MTASRYILVTRMHWCTTIDDAWTGPFNGLDYTKNSKKHRCNHIIILVHRRRRRPNIKAVLSCEELNADLTLGQRLRRWPNVKTAFPRQHLIRTSTTQWRPCPWPLSQAVRLNRKADNVWYGYPCSSNSPYLMMTFRCPCSSNSAYLMMTFTLWLHIIVWCRCLDGFSPGMSI